jgi:hypothetical protein
MDLEHDCEFLYQLNPLPESVRAGGNLQRMATGTPRFIPSGKAQLAEEHEQPYLPWINDCLTDGNNFYWVISDFFNPEFYALRHLPFSPQ